jgi:hypothetical protein
MPSFVAVQATGLLSDVPLLVGGEDGASGIAEQTLLVAS